VPRRIDAGEVLAALGGALVFVALFLSWFDGLSGWEAFEALDLVLAALALAAITAGLSSLTGRAPSARALPWIGLLLVVIVTVQLIEPPILAQSFEFDDRGGDAALIVGEAGRETGAWLALAGSALVLLGGILRLASISVTVSVGNRDVRRRVPAVDRRNGVTSPPGPAEPEPTEPTAPLSDPPPDPQATQPFGAVEAQEKE
jgi:hypothetical protein